VFGKEGAVGGEMGFEGEILGEEFSFADGGIEEIVDEGADAKLVDDAEFVFEMGKVERADDDV